MKILILASPRSGSTSLTLLLKEHLDKTFNVFFEPFNPKFYNNYKSKGNDFIDCEPLKKYENLLVKSIILVDYIEYPTNVFSNENQYIDWCISFFDKVIVLDRLNKTEQSESFVINETTQKLTGIGWHVPKIYDTNNIDLNFYNNMFESLNKTKDRLIEIVNKYHLPYFLYENLYTKDNKNEISRLFECLEIEPNGEYVDEYINNKNRRVRIEPPINKNLI